MMIPKSNSMWLKLPNSSFFVCVEPQPYIPQGLIDRKRGATAARCVARAETRRVVGCQSAFLIFCTIKSSFSMMFLYFRGINDNELLVSFQVDWESNSFRGRSYTLFLCNDVCIWACMCKDVSITRLLACKHVCPTLPSFNLHPNPPKPAHTRTCLPTQCLQSLILLMIPFNHRRLLTTASLSPLHSSLLLPPHLQRSPY